jgi:hypothetical protein
MSVIGWDLKDHSKRKKHRGEAEDGIEAHRPAGGKVKGVRGPRPN